MRGAALWLGLFCVACSPAPAALHGYPDGAVDQDAGWQGLYTPGANYVAGWVSAPGDIYAATRPMNAVEIVSSHDGGKTWGYAYVHDDAAFRSPLRSLTAVGASNVYAAGSEYDDAGVEGAPFFAVSTDGGQTFGITHPAFPGVVTAITADASGDLLAVGSAGDGGFFVRSADGAATWTRAAVPGTSALNGIWVAGDGTIYACGAVDASAPDAGARPVPGVVVRSMDGGATWAAVAQAPVSLTALSGTTGGRIVAVGSGYTEIELSAGASDWVVRAGDPSTVSDTAGLLASVWVADDTSAPYIAVNAGYLIRAVSTDPGKIPSVSFENLASRGEPGAISVAGTGPGDVWAFGTGIFHKTSP